MHFSTSLEFFPPKTVQGQDNLVNVYRSLLEYKPTHATVTCGNLKNAGTTHTTELLQECASLPVMPHLVACGQTTDDLKSLVKHHLDAARSKFVAIRGDDTNAVEGGLTSSVELVEVIRECHATHSNSANLALTIEVGCYPEVHPQAVSLKADIDTLKAKIDAGATLAVTQFFYNPDSYSFFKEQLAINGVSIPIVPGIMPIASLEHLLRMANQCGAGVPRWFRSVLKDYEDNSEDQMKLGAELVAKMIERLRSEGCDAIHIYTLNKLRPTQLLLENLGIQSA